MPISPIPMGIPGRWHSILTLLLTTLEICCLNELSEVTFPSLNYYCSLVAVGVKVLLGVSVSVGVVVMVGVEVGVAVGPGVGV
jgi:hypothetical protein